MRGSSEISPILAAGDETRATPTLRRLAWSGGADVPLGRMLLAGAVPWAAYAILHVVLEGPVLDEATVPAQIMTGAVRYPAGHPLAVLMERVPGLNYQLAALEWWLHPGVWRISVVRNLLFLFASTWVPFVATLVLVRRPMWGHLAAVLTLSEGTCRFIGVYLLWVFPSFWSSGHFGIHAAVLVPALLLAGCWRLGGLLLGLLPAIHAAMSLVVGPWGAAFLLASGHRGRPWGRVLASAAVGLAGVGVMLLAMRLHAPDVQPVPPYDATADGETILRSFMSTTDPHRLPIRVLTPAYLLSPVGFVVLATLLLWPRRDADDDRTFDRVACAWLVALGAIAWALVFGTRIVQAVGELPIAVLSTMPGRFAHVPVLLLLPLTVAALVRAVAGLVPARRPAGRVVLALLPLLLVAGLLLDRVAVYSNFVAFVWGVWLGLEWWAADPARRPVVAAGTLALLVALLVLRLVQDDPAWWIFGAGIGLGAAAVAARVRLPAIEPVAAAACVVAALVAVRGPHVANGWDQGSERISPEEARLAAWLDANAGRDELLLTPLWPPTQLQPKTGHPVLIDGVTLLTMTYMPSLAPSLGVMVRDFFGVDYARPETLRPLLGPDGTLRPTSEVWLAAWRARTCAEWVALGARYGVRLVLAPTGERLDLPRALDGERLTLHTIPATADACPTRGGA